MDRTKKRGSRKAWLKPELVGVRVHTFAGHGQLLESIDESLGCLVALESGGQMFFDASELTRAADDY